MADINHKERVLPGDTVTNNSEEYNNVLRQVQEEVGRAENTVIDEGSYTTKLIGAETAIDINKVDISPKPFSSVSELSDTDSAFGVRIRHGRQKRLKKPA